MPRVVDVALQVGQTPVGAPGRVRDGLLREEAGRGEHAQAAVLQLLGLHDAELRGVGRLQAERVEADVAGHVVVQQLLEDVLRLVRVGPALGDAQRLAATDEDGDKRPHDNGQLGELVDGGPAVAAEERVELLLHKEAGGRQHADAAVGQLGLAPGAHLLERGAGREVERVEALLERRHGADQAEAELTSLVGAGGVLGQLLRILEADLLLVVLGHDVGAAREGAGRGERRSGLEGERGRGDGEHCDVGFGWTSGVF
eukprot:scaffold2119_cov67-Phaeocystis_antarctica.AAC.6